jgi:hypothetical protein
VKSLEFAITGSDERSLWVAKGGSRSVQIPKYPDPLPPAVVMRVANSIIEAGARRAALMAALRTAIESSES